MGYLFDPGTLHAIANKGIGLPIEQAVHVVIEELDQRYPGRIRRKPNWMFNNAGGAMGTLTLLYGSLSEYVILFGTPIGTEGHSGRYWADVYDFMLDGEMWSYTEGELQRRIYRAGDCSLLPRTKARGYRIHDHAWMLEYGRGVVPLMLPFGLADSIFSTLDFTVVARLLWNYGKLATRELLTKGKI